MHGRTATLTATLTLTLTLTRTLTLTLTLTLTRYLAKRNTFTDFVDCAEHLLASGVAKPGALSCEGRSAGGLLVGNVVNMAPDKFCACIGGVPFVDLMVTRTRIRTLSLTRTLSLSPSLSLTRTLNLTRTRTRTRTLILTLPLPLPLTR